MSSLYFVYFYCFYRHYWWKMQYWCKSTFIVLRQCSVLHFLISSWLSDCGPIVNVHVQNCQNVKYKVLSFPGVGVLHPLPPRTQFRAPSKTLKSTNMKHCSRWRRLAASWKNYDNEAGRQRRGVEFYQESERWLVSILINIHHHQQAILYDAK